MVNTATEPVKSFPSDESNIYNPKWMTEVDAGNEKRFHSFFFCLHIWEKITSTKDHKKKFIWKKLWLKYLRLFKQIKEHLFTYFLSQISYFFFCFWFVKRHVQHSISLRHLITLYCIMHFYVFVSVRLLWYVC